MVSEGLNSLKIQNRTVQQYYDLLESRIGYRLFLADTRHYGYWDNADAWPWPIDVRLRAVEAKLFTALQCTEGSMLGAVSGLLLYAWPKQANIEWIGLTWSKHRLLCKCDSNDGSTTNVAASFSPDSKPSPKARHPWR